MNVRRLNAPDDNAIALVGVLVIVGLLSMIAISLMFRMQAAATASASTLRSEQAWVVALSGLDRAIDVVSDSSRTTEGWIDNSTDFEHQLVYDDGSDQWYFSVFRRGVLETDEIIFGVVDEASKLPLNATNVLQLMKVPHMTLPAVEALADFVDGDSIARDNGAEQDSYDLLPVPYSIPNKPVSFLDELLLAQGVSAAHLYGEDANRNHKLDFNENDADALFPPDNQDGTLSGGLHRFFTLHSRDWNVNRNNQPRLDINTVALDPEPAGLTDETVAFLEAKRKAGQPLASLADLVNATLIVTEENQAQRELKSGVGTGDLSQLLDRFTTDPKQIRLERVNINTAPASILAQVDGIDEALANTIVSARQGLSPEASRSIAWLLEESLLDSDQFKQIEPFIAARSFQFHIQVIGYALPSGRYRVLESIVDLIGSEPRVLYIRDLTKLGVPYPFATR
ncbi:type II secretion system protein GspK [bacterium]|nr:type II secretion system protein GspK [bacterium]MDC0277008.1 type II secretion system protein GspK [bacterium]